jgi:hypothetical protein
MKKQTLLITFALSVAVAALAEFGASAGATFNYKADFSTAGAVQGFANDPSGQVYDIGHVGGDDSLSNSGYTWDYSYTEDAIVNNTAGGGGTLTLSSAQTLTDALKSSGEQSEAQPAIEIYWQYDFTTNETFNVGFRAAFRWQRVELDRRSVYSTTTETVSDTYTYPAGNLAFDSYDTAINGTINMPGLSETPTSSATTYEVGSSYTALQELRADLFGIDLGPTLSYNITEKLRLNASVGGTLAWIDSEFSYDDGDYGNGKENSSDFLLGLYASADLSYQLGEHWGIFTGAAYTRLQGFEQEVDGRSAELEFGDSYTFRSGLFFR